MIFLDGLYTSTQYIQLSTIWVTSIYCTTLNHQLPRLWEGWVPSYIDKLVIASKGLRTMWHTINAHRLIVANIQPMTLQIAAGNLATEHYHSVIYSQDYHHVFHLAHSINCQYACVQDTIALQGSYICNF